MRSRLRSRSLATNYYCVCVWETNCRSELSTHVISINRTKSLQFEFLTLIAVACKLKKKSHMLIHNLSELEFESRFATKAQNCFGSCRLSVET